MYAHKNHAGFSIVEIVIVLAVVILIGCLGYVFINRTNSNTATQDTALQSDTNDVSSTPQINSREDLDAAEKVLDENDPVKNNMDATELDGELSKF